MCVKYRSSENSVCVVQIVNDTRAEIVSKLSGIICPIVRSLHNMPRQQSTIEHQKLKWTDDV